jgi:antitoxin component HigA of HigAB toxin-antitoxin module
MKTHFDIEKIVEKGTIANALDYERAMIADRKLRLLSKESTYFKQLRSKLRALIETYEKAEWNDLEQLTDEKISASDKYQRIAEIERVFIENRKQAIRTKLKEFDLSQENLAVILGHKSKTHMSELINGIKPFTLKDLIVINRIFHIDMKVLVPNFLSMEDQEKVKVAVQSLNKAFLKIKPNRSGIELFKNNLMISNNKKTILSWH